MYSSNIEIENENIFVILRVPGQQPLNDEIYFSLNLCNDLTIDEEFGESYKNPPLKQEKITYKDFAKMKLAKRKKLSVNTILSQEMIIYGNSLISKKAEDPLLTYYSSLLKEITELDNSFQEKHLFLTCCQVIEKSPVESKNFIEAISKLFDKIKKIQVLTNLPDSLQCYNKIYNLAGGNFLELKTKLINLYNLIAIAIGKAQSVLTPIYNLNPKVEKAAIISDIKLSCGDIYQNIAQLRKDVEEGKKLYTRNDMGKCPTCNLKLTIKDINKILGKRIVEYTKMLNSTVIHF